MWGTRSSVAGRCRRETASPRRVSGPSPRRVRPRTWALALLIALVVAAGATLATEAQARKTSPQHVIIHITCNKVTYLFLGFPEGVTNGVHPKVKVNGKVVNNYKTATNFYGSIAESESRCEIPVTGKYLIQAGATWNTNEVVGESSDHQRRKRPCPGDGEAAFTIEKEQRLSGEAAYTSERTPGQSRADVEYHVVLKNTGTNADVLELPGPELRKSQKRPDQRSAAAKQPSRSPANTRSLRSGSYTNEASIEANRRHRQTEFEHGQGQRSRGTALHAHQGTEDRR